MRAQRSLLPLLLTFAAHCFPPAAQALGQAAEFKVVISLNVMENGRCVSQSWSAKAQATVQVVCSTGQFVDIEPARGKPYTGTHGSAFRYHLTTDSLPAGALVSRSDPHLGAGTITALRIYNINGGDGPLEMLVSF